MTERQFIGWGKIPRLFRTMTVTEKLDGTNAAVVITDNDIYAQSRKRLLTPDDDNFGFATWVENNQESLRADLGTGRHYGEWFGYKIQRGYGLPDRMFSLFNVDKWEDSSKEFFTPRLYVVPVLHRGEFDLDTVSLLVHHIKTDGSRINNFPRPEGIVVRHDAGGALFKVTCENDDLPKGNSNA